MEKAYVYDFDKTVYNGDSSIDFFFFCLSKKVKLVKYIAIIVYYFCLYILHIISTKKFKEKFFMFLKEFDNIDEIVKLFWEKNKNKTYNFFNEVLEVDGRPTIYIVSSSPKFLLEVYTKKIKNVKLIATNMDKCTGKIDGENCKGIEKLKCLPKNIKIEKFYSDSYTDRYVAEKADKAYIAWNGNVSEWTKEKFKKKRENKIAFLIFMFFLTVYLILGIYLSYLYDAGHSMSLIFSADSKRVLNDMNEIFGNHYRIKVHPLYILLVAPLTYIIRGFTVDSVLASIVFSSIISSLSIMFLYKISCLFINDEKVKILITLIFGFTFTNIIFSSTIETYNVAGLLLLLLWYLIIYIFKTNKKIDFLDLFFMYLLGISSISITLTNYIVFLIVSFILLISKRVNFKKIFFINILVIFSAVALSLVQHYVWHNTPTLLNYSTNYTEEERYINWDVSLEKSYNVLKLGYIDSILPSSLIVEDNFIKLGTLNLIPLLFSLVLYLIIVINLIKNYKNNTYLNLGIILSIAFNVVLHMFYGNVETFLYSCHFIFYPFLLLIINYNHTKYSKYLFMLILLVELLNNAKIFRKVLVLTNIIFKSSNYYLRFNNFIRLFFVVFIIFLIYILIYLLYRWIKKIFTGYESKKILYLIGSLCCIMTISLIFVGISTAPKYNEFFNIIIKE